MAKDKTTLRFWLRTDRPNKDGTAPVHLIYQIQGQRKYYAVPDAKLLEENWQAKPEQLAIYLDKKAARAKLQKKPFDMELLLTAEEVAKINKKLSDVRNDVKDVETRFKLDEITFSPQMVIDALNEKKRPETKRDEPGRNIVDFITRFCAETTDHKEGTKKAYTGLANHMADYEKLKKERFTFEGDATILKRFSQYLSGLKVFNKKANREEHKVNNITKAKLFSTFKTLLRYAKRPPYKIKVNPDYLDYTEKSIKRKDSEFEVIALTSEELSAIIDLDLTENTSLDEARDIFVFSCVTGLRYGDLRQLSRKHIKRDNTIHLPASDKNSKRIDIPLNPVSFAIIQKYQHLRTPLPVTAHKQELISDQKLNDNIKKVGKLAKIDTEIEIVRPYGLNDVSLGMYKKHDLLSIHVGRKTFTTLSLAKGAHIQDVMALTTHTSFKAVQRYIDVTKDRRKTVMAETWGKIDDNNLKAV